MYIFLFQTMIKNPVYQYRIHWLFQPIRIEAPSPYIRICPSLIKFLHFSWNEIIPKFENPEHFWLKFNQKCSGFSNLGINSFQEKCKNFLLLFCHHRPIYEYAIWQEVLMTPVSWCFAIICIIIHLIKNAHPFLIVSLQANIWNTSYDQKSQQT